MTLFITGLVLFLGIHSVAALAPAARARLIERLGAGAWRGLYSAIAVVGFVLIAVGYVQARATPVLLYLSPYWMRYVVIVLLLPVFPLLIAAYLPGRIKARLKHPMLVAVKLWAVGHLLTNGLLTDVLLFGGFLAWAVMVRISLKRRGPQPVLVLKPTAGRNDAIALLAGLALHALMVTGLHERLIGTPILPLIFGW